MLEYVKAVWQATPVWLIILTPFCCVISDQWYLKMQIVDHKSWFSLIGKHSPSPKFIKILCLPMLACLAFSSVRAGWGAEEAWQYSVEESRSTRYQKHPKAPKTLAKVRLRVKISTPWYSGLYELIELGTWQFSCDRATWNCCCLRLFLI